MLAPVLMGCCTRPCFAAIWPNPKSRAVYVAESDVRLVRDLTPAALTAEGVPNHTNRLARQIRTTMLHPARKSDPGGPPGSAGRVTR